jgi:hypothetical protein
MKQKILLLLLLILTISKSEINAQKYKGNWEKTEEDKKESKKFLNNFFISAGFSPFISLHKYSYIDTYMDGADVIESVETKSAFSVLDIELNLRYNLFNHHDNFSISTTFSPSFALIGDGASSVGINTPIGIDFNFFNHSTFNNIDNLGFSISGGLIRHNFVADKGEALASNFKWNDLFGRFTFKYRKYKASFSTNYKPNKYYYSYFAIQYGSSNQTLTMTNGTESTNKFNHFKIVFGKIFRY